MHGLLQVSHISDTLIEHSCVSWYWLTTGQQIGNKQFQISTKLAVLDITNNKKQHLVYVCTSKYQHPVSAPVSGSPAPLPLAALHYMLQQSVEQQEKIPLHLLCLCIQLSVYFVYCYPVLCVQSNFGKSSILEHKYSGIF